MVDNKQRQEREEYKINVKQIIEKHNINIISTKDIEYKEKLGSGGTATVRLAIYNKKEIVVKKLSGKLDWKCLADELEILLQLEHPCIPKFYGLILDDCILSMVFQYIKGFTLDKLDVMKMERSVVLDILKNLANTFDYIHNKSYIHRDFKADNAMIDNKLKVWVIDFGIAKKTSEVYYKTRAKGNVFWVAPENFAMDEKNKAIITNKVDIWGFGLITSFFFSGVEPWHNISKIQAKVQDAILEETPFPIPGNIKDEKIVNLIKSCVNYDPGSRPSFKDIIEYLKDIK